MNREKLIGDLEDYLSKNQLSKREKEILLGWISFHSDALEVKRRGPNSSDPETQSIKRRLSQNLDSMQDKFSFEFNAYLETVLKEIGWTRSFKEETPETPGPKTTRNSVLMSWVPPSA